MVKGSVDISQVDSWDAAGVACSREDSDPVWRSADVDIARRQSALRPHQRQEQNTTQEALVSGNWHCL